MERLSFCRKGKAIKNSRQSQSIEEWTPWSVLGRDYVSGFGGFVLVFCEVVNLLTVLKGMLCRSLPFSQSLVSCFCYLILLQLLRSQALSDPVEGVLSWLNCVLSGFAVPRTSWCVCTVPCAKLTVRHKNLQPLKSGTWLAKQLKTVLCESAFDC